MCRYCLPRYGRCLRGLMTVEDGAVLQLVLNMTQVAVPVTALAFVTIYFLCGIYFVYLDPKYNFWVTATASNLPRMPCANIYRKVPDDECDLFGRWSVTRQPVQWLMVSSPPQVINPADLSSLQWLDLYQCIALRQQPAQRTPAYKWSSSNIKLQFLVSSPAGLKS